MLYYERFKGWSLCVGLAFALMFSTISLNAESYHKKAKLIHGPWPKLRTNGILVKDVYFKVDALIKVKKDGTVESITILKSSYPRINSLLKEAVMGWKYEPEIINGKPVDAVIRKTLYWGYQSDPIYSIKLDDIPYMSRKEALTYLQKNFSRITATTKDYTIISDIRWEEDGFTPFNRFFEDGVPRKIPYSDEEEICIRNHQYTKVPYSSVSHVGTYVSRPRGLFSLNLQVMLKGAASTLSYEAKKIYFSVFGQDIGYWRDIQKNVSIIENPIWLSNLRFDWDNQEDVDALHHTKMVLASMQTLAGSRKNAEEEEEETEKAD